MKTEEAIYGRRSIRKFRKTHVPRKDIIRIVKAGTMAPSACNRQHWQFVIVTETPTKKRIYEETGTHKIILEAPLAICVFYDSSVNNEHHANVQSVAAAVQNMCLSAYELGYGTLWMCNFGDTEALKKILNVPEKFEPMCILLLGVPDSNPPVPYRKDIEDILHFDRFSNMSENLPTSSRTSLWTTEEIKRNQRYSYSLKNPIEEREIYHPEDLKLIKSILDKNIRKGSGIITLFNYDGTVLSHAIESMMDSEVTDCEFTKEASFVVRKKAGKDIRFIEYGHAVPAKDNEFDTVVMLFSPNKFPDRDKLFKEAYRILKPGGRMIVFMKNSISFFGLVYRVLEKMGFCQISKSYLSPDPFEPFSIRKAIPMMKGFRVLSKKSLCFMPRETLFYNQKIKSYLKMHGTRRKEILILTGMNLFNLFARILSFRGPAMTASTVCIICEK